MKLMNEHRNNHRPGFTLIETLIVLVLVCSFVLLPTIAIKSWQQELEKKFFYYQFEKSILHLQQVAIVDSRSTRIELYPDKQFIIFFTNHTELPWRQLDVPKSVKLVSKGSVFFGAETGNITTDQSGNGNIPKIIFNAEGQIIYQFQMGSGKTFIYNGLLTFLPQIYHSL